MRKVGIVTDSHSSISQDEAKKLGIWVLPMPFYIDEECYYEGTTLSREEFFDKLKSKQKLTTSQPSPAEVMGIWDEALKECETIVYIPISSGLSSSCATATAFALEDDYEGKVFVVDNGRVATPLHQTILDAIDLINIGKTAKEVKEILERMRDKMSIYIVVDDLEYLKRGGRINATTATLGTILNVKPILRFDVGILDQYKKCRGVKAAKKAMLEAMKNELETKFKEYYDKGQVRLLAASSAGKEETDEWVNEIREAFGGVEVLCDDLSMGVSCHIGPGGLGIGCSCRPDELHG